MKLVLHQHTQQIHRHPAHITLRLYSQSRYEGVSGGTSSLEAALCRPLDLLLLESVFFNHAQSEGSKCQRRNLMVMTTWPQLAKRSEDDCGLRQARAAGSHRIFEDMTKSEGGDWEA